MGRRWHELFAASDFGDRAVSYTEAMLPDAAVINQAAVYSIILSGVALVAGVFFIKQNNRDAHMKAMMTATVFAVLFLVLYLTRLAMGYEKSYAGPEEWRMAYYALLISHVILAAANLPLGVVPVVVALKARKATGGRLDPQSIGENETASAAFATHRKWVKWAVPVWLYVAVTGWIIYVILGRWGTVMHPQG